MGNNINRRSFLQTGFLAGFAANSSSASQAGQPGGGLLTAIDSAPRVYRGYSALDSAGQPTHALRLSISLPMPHDGTLESDCWHSRVRITNLQPNPTTGFPGGIFSDVVKGKDSVAAFLAATKRADAALMSSHEAQVGSVVWSEFPQAANYGLPSDVDGAPCTGAIELGGWPKSPVQVANARLKHPCGDLSEIVLIRDLIRTETEGTQTVVRCLFAMPQPCQGPAPSLVSYACSFQIQGLQAAEGNRLA